MKDSILKDYMIPILWHSGKGRTDSKKDQWFPGVWEGEGWIVKT